MSSLKYLEVKRNCWRLEKAEKAAFLIDGESYFKAFVQAARQARHSIYILGWEIDSRVKLLRGSDDEDDLTLGKFLNQLAKSKPELEVHLLIWDYAMIYALEREPLPLYTLGWKSHQRVHFRSDSRHPIAASHHQKVVVIDDKVAFCGGLDLTKHRWDTPEHKIKNKRRREPGGELYAPFHDVQMVVSGAVAECLGELFRGRWHNATHHKLPSPAATDNNPWPESVTPDIEDVDVAISRTCPQFNGQPEVREVQNLYLDTIAKAEKWIYLENQYFTSYAVRQALEESLGREKGPEIVLVFSKRSMGWLEEGTMDVLRTRIIERLRHADEYDRLRVYYPEIPGLGEKCLKVHSKVMVVDDDFARVGSSNTNNRSMGLDTECDLSVEAAGKGEVESAIASFRNRLLGEHLDVDEDDVARTLRDQGSLIKTIEHLRGDGRTLKDLPMHEPDWEETFYPDAEWIDPEQPIQFEKWLERFNGKEVDEDKRNGLVKLGVLGLLLVGMVVLWRWTPVKDWLSMERLAEWGEYIRQSTLGPILIVGTFVIGSLVAFPITVLIGATALIFGPVSSLIYSSLGSFLGAALSYGAGRGLGRDLVRRLAGKRLNRISKRLASRGALSVGIVRVVPVAPFTVINFVAGASHIRFRDFMLGTVVGMFPGIVAITVFSEQLKEFVQDPSIWMLVVLIGLIGLIAGGGYIFRKWLGKKTEADKDQPV